MNASKTEPRSNVIVVILAAVCVLASMMQTIITPLIADLPRILDSSAANTAWVVTATLLTAAVWMPVAGRLGDMVGKRRMILVSAVPLVIGSVVCALAVSVVPMIVGRALQGMGLGVVSLSISLLRDLLPPKKLSASVALMSASLGIGGGLGLPIAAAVVQFSNWRVLFWGSAVLAAVVMVLVLYFVPEGMIGAKGQRFDYVGAITLAAGLVSFMLAISKGSDWGWTSGTTLGLLIAAVILLGVWGWWELRTREPLVDLRTTARPQVLLTNIASMFAGIGMYATMLVTPQILMLPTSTGFGLGQTLLATGLLMLPGGVIQVFLAPLGGKLIDSRGPKFTLILGAGIIFVGYICALFLMRTAPGLMVAHMVIKAGVGISYGAMPALIMGNVPRSETSAANSFNSLMRSLGSSIGAAVIGVVIAQTAISSSGHDLMSEGGARIGLAIGGGVGLVAAIVASFLAGKRRKDAEKREILEVTNA